MFMTQMSSHRKQTDDDVVNVTGGGGVYGGISLHGEEFKKTPEMINTSPTIIGNQSLKKPV